MGWLALAKHHGLPTRLLDWTLSPLVALHFATASAALRERDGVIWCVDYAAAHSWLPLQLATALDEEGSELFTTQMLARTAPGLEELDALGEDFLVVVEPPALDERIVNQYSVFSLMPGPRSRLGDWLEERPEIAQRLIVPAALKPELRDKARPGQRHRARALSRP